MAAVAVAAKRHGHGSLSRFHKKVAAAKIGRILSNVITSTYAAIWVTTARATRAMKNTLKFHIFDVIETCFFFFFAQTHTQKSRHVRLLLSRLLTNPDCGLWAAGVVVAALATAMAATDPPPPATR